MITEKDLHEAIAECQGQRNPNANTCIKLASFYTIMDHLYGDKKPDSMEEKSTGYSFDSPRIIYSSETEFGQIAEKADTAELLGVIDEMMETIRVMQPRLYDAFIRKITAL